MLRIAVFWDVGGETNGQTDRQPVAMRTRCNKRIQNTSFFMS